LLSPRAQQLMLRSILYLQLDECMTLWGEPEWVHMQNVDQLHAYDCYQNVTESQATEYHTKVHKCTTQEQWVRLNWSMLHTGWSSTHRRSCGDGMDRWKPSFLACATSSPHLCQKRSESSDRNRELGNKDKRHWQIATWGYVCHSRHWIGKSTSSLLLPSEVDCSRFTSSTPIHPRAPFWINAWHKTSKIRAGSDLQ